MRIDRQAFLPARSSRWRSRTLALATMASLAPAPALAQSDSPSVPVRYAPLTAPERVIQSGLPSPLYPLADPQRAPASQAPALFNDRSGALDYSINQVAARMVVEVARNGVAADGQSPVPVTLRVFGADGKVLGRPVWASIETSGGRILLPGAATDEAGPRGKDADRTTPGVQLEVRNGVARFFLLAPSAPQDVQLRVTVGAQEASGVVSFVPEMREMIAAGLLEGVINFRAKAGGQITPALRDNGFDREIRAWGREFNDGKANLGARAALFLKGTVRGDYLLTASYDSDKETRARLLRDILPDQMYPVYGDSSLRGEEAISSDRLYLRVDRNKNYLMYGDFATGDGFSQRSGGNVAAIAQRSLGNYNRSATGVRYHYEQGGALGNVFAFRDTLRQVSEEFASQGSGPYGLHNNAVLEGSEKVEKIVRDRDQPSRIVSVTPMTRLVDYTFEPFSGRILLNTFLASADASLNPVSLRVTYEVDQGGSPFWVAGADGQLRISEQFDIGGSFVKDDNPLAPQQLSSANVTWRIAPATTLVAEVARTSATVNTNGVNASTLPGLIGVSGTASGNAWRLELAHEDKNAEARLFVGRSEPGFNNLAAPLTGGHGEASGMAAFKLNDSVKLYAKAQRSDDSTPGSATSSAAQLGVITRLSERLTLDTGVRALHESAGSTNTFMNAPFSSTSGLSGSIATGSGGGAVGFGNQLLDPASGLPIINPGNVLGSVASTSTSSALQSNTLRAGLGYKLSERVTLGGEVEHDISGEARRRVALGADMQIAERTRLYGRFERQTGLDSAEQISSPDRRGNALIFGLDSTYLQDTQLFNEYRLRDALSGPDAQMASGIRNVWNFAPGLRLNTAYEHTRVISGQVPNADAVSVGVDYSAHPLWRGSTKVEWRRSGDIAGSASNEAFDTTLWQVMAARKLDRDWTFLGRNYLLKTAYAALGGVLQDRLQFGLAYRDTDSNRVNALGKVELKTERDDSNSVTGSVDTHALVLSTHADWHPARPWWWTGRVAAKWQNDLFEGGVRDRFQAQLLSGRVVYDITENWDIGAMLANQFGQHGARQSAAGIEAGYLVQQNLWLSAGFNRTGFAGDADLSGYEYTQKGVYLRLRFKFDEHLFMHDNPGINRSLERPTSGVSK